MTVPISTSLCNNLPVTFLSTIQLPKGYQLAFFLKFVLFIGGSELCAEDAPSGSKI